jgi:hypothetical protein
VKFDPGLEQSHLVRRDCSLKNGPIEKRHYHSPGGNPKNRLRQPT